MMRGPRGPSLFKQRDITTAIRAAKAAGADNCVVEIARDGTIRVIVTSAGGRAERNPWDGDEG
jgi:hypothetical protein